jgi:hypothetical protein
MTEFKKGDKVTVREGATSIGGQARDPKEVRTVQTVWDDGRVGLYPVHPAAPGNVFESEDLERRFPAPAEDHGTGDGSASDICAEPGCNCDLERRFPAPLDPSKVKAGDTVTLEKGTAKHVDLVADVDRYQDGDYRFKSTTSPTHVYRVGDGAWTLTAHQPAPEPEPEWTDGTVAEVTYNNADETEQFKTRALRGDGSWVPFADVSDLIDDDEVTDVRPLVVIDPADVDEQNRLAAIIRRVDGNHDLGAAALAEAILEHLGLNR